MTNLVYRRKEFVIIKVAEHQNEFIVVNTRKKFEDGHTHMKSFKKAKSIIDLIYAKKLPYGESIRFLTSITRVCENCEYREKVEELINVKRQKGKKEKYINRCM